KRKGLAGLRGGFRSLAFVSWEIGANLGRHERPGVDARGWLWEITCGDQVAQVVIEISGTAWSSDPLRLPEDTLRALETDGRTELLKVLEQDDPPRVIQCGSTGWETVVRYRPSVRVSGVIPDPGTSGAAPRLPVHGSILTGPANGSSLLAIYISQGGAMTEFLDVPGGRIAYDVTGGGLLVVCVPGMGDMRASFRFLTPPLPQPAYPSPPIEIPRPPP